MSKSVSPGCTTWIIGVGLGVGLGEGRRSGVRLGLSVGVGEGAGVVVAGRAQAESSTRRAITPTTSVFLTSFLLPRSLPMPKQHFAYFTI